MHYKLIISLVFLFIGCNALAQNGTVYTYQGKNFKPGDQIMIQSRAGTIKSVDSGHYNRIEGNEGKKGELIRVDLDVATVKWDAQTWDEYGTKRQIKLPSFVSTVHLGYIEVLASKDLSKEKLAEYENYTKYSDEEAKKTMQKAEELIAKYGDKYIYKAPEEDKGASSTNSKKEKIRVASVEKEAVPLKPEPDVEEVILPPEPEVEEVKEKEKELSTNTLISIGLLVGVLAIFLLIYLSWKKFND